MISEQIKINKYKTFDFFKSIIIKKVNRMTFNKKKKIMKKEENEICCSECGENDDLMVEIASQYIIDKFGYIDSCSNSVHGCTYKDALTAFCGECGETDIITKKEYKVKNEGREYAFEEGNQAFNDGKEMSTNPYENSNQYNGDHDYLRDAMIDGYEEAKEEDQTKNKICK